MADLLTELQHLASAVTPRRRLPDTDPVGCAADPLLLDEVYTCTPHTSAAGSSEREFWAAQTSSGPMPKDRTSQAGASAAIVQQSNGSFTSGTTSLNSLAALAAYKRQLYLGLDPANAAAATAVPGGSRPCSGAPPTLQGAITGKRSFALKSRPTGMSSPDFGSAHVPGLLPRFSLQDPSAPCTPAQSGMGPIVPPRLFSRSCCPPPWPEALTAAAEGGPGIVAARQADRESLDEQLLNRLVYDSLQPNAARTDSPASFASSCRTTTSHKSLHANASAVSAGTTDAADCDEQAQQQLDLFDYAPGLASWYMPEGPGDTTLVFESRFESGNLRRAIQVTEFEYDLVLQPDINTRGHTQWFFFAVCNMRAGEAYRFNIINLLKEDSTYNMGMLPLMHSEQQMRNKGAGWVRCGSCVAYGANSIVCHKKQAYYTLTFTVEFPYDQDLVHLAHCYPFTWTDQQTHIHVLKQSLPPDTILQHTTLATSLAGNAVDLLTITAAPDKGRPVAQRQGVVLSARVHPGETNSSWLMKGAVEQLLADTKEAAQLRETFVFKVVPMLNPDGVIVGNYRCSLAGLDLNRVYQAPDSRLQPVICAFKDMVRAFTQEREVVLSCDMHGHSRRFGIFMYGCEKKPGKDLTPIGPGYPMPGSLGGLPCVPSRHQERIFPLMLALNAPDLFSYKSCNFKVQKSKSGTGRVVGFRELGLVNAYTMEASFAGAAVGKYAKQHFNAGHLEEMGSAVVRTLLDYWAPAEINSAPELCTQLDAALLSGVTDNSGPSSGSAGMGATGVGSAFEKLGLCEAGDEEDSCTDSDDESSDDDKPAARPVSSRPVSMPAGDSAAGAKGSGGVVNQGGAAGNAVSLADIGRQLTDLLSSNLAVDAGKAAGGTGAAAGSIAAVGAVRNLLEAIKASENAASSAAIMAASSSPADRAKLPATKGPTASGSSAASAASACTSSSKAAPDPAQHVTLAAQQLLDKLTVAKAKAQACAALPAGVVDGSGDFGGPGGSVSLPPAGRGQLLPLAVAVAAAADVLQPSTSQAASIPAAAVSVGAAAKDAAAVPAGALSEEEAALLVIPGLPEILEQLVQQTAQHKSKAASAGKKKGRRKGRWGNPEVLRAARAMADAGLAAALPELGVTLPVGTEPDAAEAWWEDGSCSSSLSTPTTPSVPYGPEVPLAGRRARTAGSRSSKGSSLNVERYMYCLEVQKRTVGGVLASSSTDSAWDGTAVISPRSQQPSSFTSSSTPFSSSKSIGRKAVMFAGSAEQQPDALEVAMSGPAAGMPAEIASPGTNPPGVSQYRRSKSAYPWLDQ